MSSAEGGAPRGRRTTFIVAIALVATSILLILGAEPRADTNPSATPGMSKSGGCDDVAVPVYCRQVRIDDRVLRYALLPAPSSTASTVVVDLGGPGYSLFGTSAIIRLADDLPAELQQMNVIALEEPWVQREVTPACDHALSTYYLESRAVLEGEGVSRIRALAEPSANLSRSCALGEGNWGWSGPAYSQALQQVLSAHNLVLDGFIGISFGSVRSAYVAPQIASWVMLDGPAAVGLDAGRFLTDLEGEAMARLESCASCGRDGLAVEQSIGGLRRRLQAAPVVLEQRSLPVSGADVGPAVFALARVPAEINGAAALLGAASVDVGRGRQLGDFSDRIWGRYDRDRLSPAYLAYLDEVCATYADWQGALAPPATSTVIGEFLQTFHEPCRGDPPSHRARAQPIYSDVSWACVVSSVDDPITSSSYAAQWAEYLPGAQLHQRAGSEHGRGQFSACSSAPWKRSTD